VCEGGGTRGLKRLAKVDISQLCALLCNRATNLNTEFGGETPPYSQKGSLNCGKLFPLPHPTCKDLPLQLPGVPSILLLRAVTLLLTRCLRN